MKNLKEVLKFAARMLVFLIPVIVNYLTGAGYTQEATALSALLALIDKYLHVSDVPVKGITPF